MSEPWGLRATACTTYFLSDTLHRFEVVDDESDPSARDLRVVEQEEGKRKVK